MFVVPAESLLFNSVCVSNGWAARVKIGLKGNSSGDAPRRRWASYRDERVSIVNAGGGLLIMQIQFNNQFRLNFDAIARSNFHACPRCHRLSNFNSRLFAFPALHPRERPFARSHFHVIRDFWHHFEFSVRGGWNIHKSRNNKQNVIAINKQRL